MGRALHIKTAVSHYPEKGVGLMGNRTKVLRFAICLIVILAMMIYISPKVY